MRRWSGVPVEVFIPLNNDGPMDRTGTLKICSEAPITALEAWCRATGYSRQRLADAAGINKVSVISAAKGRRCGARVGQALAKVTGLSVAPLLSLETRNQWTIELEG